ncbi:MAG: type II secretion system minor pseudopilin GspJ [Gammaproteobacteria bacterium]|jgi:general secretion pathway protein J|nr:type II secretion system minor pseudopilin GspJ [Gammaproteobacteria bacterium]
MSTRLRRSTGFTLLELLIALAIFAIMSVVAYGGLRTVLEARDRAAASADRLAELQLAFTIIGRDFEQAIDRPIRDEFGDREPAMQGTEDGLELTRGGWRNPAGLQRSELQRVAYSLEGEELLRQTWQVLDRTQGSEPRSTALLAGVEELSLRYLDANREWRDFWPTGPATMPGAEGALPIGIEISITTERWGRVTRLFRVVPGAPAGLPEGPGGSQEEQGGDEAGDQTGTGPDDEGGPAGAEGT